MLLHYIARPWLEKLVGVKAGVEEGGFLRNFTLGFVTLVLASLAAWTPPSRAAEDAFDLAATSFPATAHGDVPAVVRVRMRSDETLRFTVELWPEFDGPKPARKFHRSLRLSPAAFDDLLLDVKVLSGAQIRVTGGPGQDSSGIALCMVIPNALMRTGELDVLRGWDPRTDTFLGPFERVLQEWCWNSHKISLDPNVSRYADDFRKKVEILAAQTLRHRLTEVLR